MSKQQSKIDSEFKFLSKLLIKIILFPLVLIQVIFGKKKFKHLFEVINHIFDFFYQAKFTFFIIIINIVLFLISPFFSENILKLFINYPIDVLSLRFFTIITSGFMHASFLHLFGNIFAIFIFGRIVEKKLGTKKTMFIYFGSLIISSIFSSLIHLIFLNLNVGGLGASGALMGLVSTAILINPFYLTYFFIPFVPIPIMIVGWLTIWADIMGILNPSFDGIGHFAHLGGFLAITIIMFFLTKIDRKKLIKGFLINLVFLILMFAIIRSMI